MATAQRASTRKTVDQLLAEARSRYRRLTPIEAYAAMQEGGILIDTRCVDLRRETAVVPGSRHIPLSVLPWRIDPASSSADPLVADPAHRIILMCSHGYSSSLAAAWLHDLGFEHVTDVEGGFEAWRAAGLPVEPSPSDPIDQPSVGPGTR